VGGGEVGIELQGAAELRLGAFEIPILEKTDVGGRAVSFGERIVEGDRLLGRSASFPTCLIWR
jgi:hypothetical protein